jgi:hypothetical protein
MKPQILLQPYRTNSYVIKNEEGRAIGRIEVEGDMGADDLLTLIRKALEY